MRRVLAEDGDDKASAEDDGEGTGEGDDSKDEETEEEEEEEDKSGIDKNLVLADPKHKANFVICAEKIE